MRCNSVQKRLSLWANEPHSEREAQAVKAHLAKCDSCSAYWLQVQGIDALAREDGLSTQQLPAGVIDRQARPVSSSRGIRWTPIAATCGLIATLVIASHRGGPGLSASAAEAVQHMKVALQKATSEHIQYFQATGPHQEGPLQLIHEVWHEQGKWREAWPDHEAGESIKIQGKDGTKFYGFDPKTHEAYSAVELAPQQSDFTMGAFFQQFNGPTATTPVRDLGPSVTDGMETELVQYGDDWQQTRVWLIPSTDLPVRIERQNKDQGAWYVSWVIVCQFNQPIADSVFDPKTLKAPDWAPVIKP